MLQREKWRLCCPVKKTRTNTNQRISSESNMFLAIILNEWTTLTEPQVKHQGQNNNFSLFWPLVFFSRQTQKIFEGWKLTAEINNPRGQSGTTVAHECTFIWRHRTMWIMSLQRPSKANGRSCHQDTCMAVHSYRQPVQYVWTGSEAILSALLPLWLPAVILCWSGRETHTLES